MTLADTQALFAQILTGGEPVGRERIEACFAGSPDLPAADRLQIYADMYGWRLADALRESFPLLAQLLGGEEWAGLAEDYLRRHPSEHHDIGQFGRLLPLFLRAAPDPERPWLADLAELEWVRQEIFFAPNAEAAGPEIFAGLAPERFAESALRLSPALRLLRLEHDVAPLWRRLRDGGDPEPPGPGPRSLAVWREGFEVYHRSLGAEEAEALRRAEEGKPMGSVCAAFGEGGAAAAAAHAALSSWLAAGWVAGLEPA